MSNVNPYQLSLKNIITSEDEHVSFHESHIEYRKMEGNSLELGVVMFDSIQSVHYEHNRSRSIAAFSWIFLAVIVTISLYFMLDALYLRIPAVVITTLMTVYLLYDHYSSPSKPSLVIKTQDNNLAFHIITDTPIELVRDIGEVIGSRKSLLRTNSENNERTFIPR